MRKIFSVVITAAMILGLGACGQTASPDAAQGTAAEPEATQEAPAQETNGDQAAEPQAEPASDGTAQSEKVTLRFYNYALSETAKAEWWDKTAANFEAQNENTDIETITVDYNSMVTTLTNDLASGLSVDMVYGELSWIPALAEGGFIQQPSQVLDADFYGGYYPHVINQATYNGEVYAVPHYYTNSVIFVNKNLIEAAGLSMDDFPATLDGLKAWIEQLNGFYGEASGVTSVFGLTTSEVPATGANINAIYTAFGGTLINEDGSLADLSAEPNKTAMTETLDFYKYLIDNGYTQENLKLKDYRASFGAGNICMYVDSSWGYAQIADVDANASAFTVTAPLPTTMGTNGKGASLVESHCFLLGANLTDAQKEAVNAFIQYCTQIDTMQDYLDNIGLAFVAHENMADYQISPILNGAAAQVDNVVYQTMIEPMISVQVQLATTVLDYVMNGTGVDDAIAAYTSEAEYYITQ